MKKLNKINSRKVKVINKMININNLKKNSSNDKKPNKLVKINFNQNILLL